MEPQNVPMTQDIQVLSPHLADLIAAGEVVERPASVVKELVENAIDAGAKAVTVEIQRGGMAMIRVADDGKGIPAGQCQRAFLRHATSKLRRPEDLAAIGTLGFRGEALAAIAAVARIELFTRPAGEDLGTALTLEGGEVVSQEPAGCPLGTTLVVRDLFFNTPARLKFMKRDAAEGAAVFALVQKLALSHPAVSVKFLRDGKQELLTPGDGTLRAALYAVLGRDMALGFLPVEGTGEEVGVTGFVSLPACCRGSRSYQHIFVNGRPVKSPLLTTALEKAYENQKMVGRFPGCVLQVAVKASAVDVNVHPAKTEVKFLSEKKAFDAVYYTVLSALTQATVRPEVTFAPKKEPVPAPAPLRQETIPLGKTVPLRDPSAALLRPLERVSGTEASTQPPVPPRPAYTPAYTPAGSGKAEFSPKSAEKSTVFPKNVDKPVENVEKPVDNGENSPRTPVDTPKPAPAPAPPQPAEEEIPWRLAGEVLQTYIIVEQGEVVHFIDKHAAHERMHFDRMKAEGYRPMAQTLLSPVVFTPGPQEGEILLENAPLLAQFGFSCEAFGGGALVVREIPDYLDPGQVEPALCELAGELLSGGGADPAGARDALLHTMACKAAVKGGQKNSPQELLAVAREVLAGRVKYCPHGRPVAITLTKAQLEKQFKRA